MSLLWRRSNVLCWASFASLIPLCVVKGVNQPFVHRWNNNYRNLYAKKKVISTNQIFQTFENLWADTSTIDTDKKRQNMLEDIALSKAFPFTKEDLSKQDETNDSIFYRYPRFVKHIDDYAIEALKSYYKEIIPKKDNKTFVLDLCSSWISHFPVHFDAFKVIGLGMNEKELKMNPLLDEYIVQNINVELTLPFPDNYFDYVVNAMSVDYMVKPKEIFEEVLRILKPGGMYINSFSNRYFPSKVVNIWLRTNDEQHVEIVGNYFSSTNFKNIVAYDLSTRSVGDPLYVVQAVKYKAEKEKNKANGHNEIVNNL